MKRLLLFAHYDRDGLVDKHVLYLLKALKPFCSETVFISNSPVSGSDRADLDLLVDRIICRENRGFDFGAWSEALNIYASRLEDFDTVLLVNNSCYGPLFPLQEMFDTMAARQCDFWGITEYSGTHHMPAHVQSYFMEIRKPMLLADEFKDFFRKIGSKCTDFEQAVRQGEAGFSQAMYAAGFTGDCYIKMDLSRQAFNVGVCETFSYNCAHYLIEKYRMPLVKIKSFAKISHRPIFRSAEIFQAIRNSGSDYPEQLIVDHLRRTTPLSWHKNLPQTMLAVDRNARITTLPTLKFAVVIHLFYLDSFAELIPYLRNIPVEFDLLVTSPDLKAADEISKYRPQLTCLQNIRVFQTVNRGRDIGAWLCGIPADEHFKYDVILKIHVKKSPQMPEAFTREWQNFMNDNLLGSPALAAGVLQAFADEPALGTVFPPYPPEVTLQCPEAFAGNSDAACAGKEFLQKLNLAPPPETTQPVFGVGSMFYYRPEALKKLLTCGMLYEDFPAEPLPLCGTITHALERLIPYIAQADRWYYRHSIHTDSLSRSFRTYENMIIYASPTLKEALKILLRSIVISWQYRTRHWFGR